MPPPIVVRANTENIILQSIGGFVPGINEQNCVSMQLSFNMTGGSFSISVLKDSILPLPTENTVFTLPYGRVGVVRQVGSAWSGGGLVDTISGTISPLALLLQTFFGIASGGTIDLKSAALGIYTGVIWSVPSPFYRGFTFRGNALAGIQQLASLLYAETIVTADGVHVVTPGSSVGDKVFFPKSDLVQASQTIDYSLDVQSILSPVNINAGLDSVYVYDSAHAQKQPKFTVQAGAPGSSGASDFIPIPDGWLVDGNYEEWTPPSLTDFTNPTPGANVTSGRYWKIFQSPTNPGMLRGITNFTRLVKQINIPGNVSTFIGSPITGVTRKNTDKEFQFNIPSTESGISGFQADETTLFDVISHQYYTFPNAIVLKPHGGVDSGPGATSFYSITMEIWTFPKVDPQGFPIGNPANPFNLPARAVIVTPSSSFTNIPVAGQICLANFRLANSPRLKTSISVPFRNFMPQIGAPLSVDGLTYKECGRISSVSLSLGRSGITLNITAESYAFVPGLFSITSATEIIFGQGLSSGSSSSGTGTTPKGRYEFGITTVGGLFLP